MKMQNRAEKIFSRLLFFFGEKWVTALTSWEKFRENEHFTNFQSDKLLLPVRRRTFLESDDDVTPRFASSEEDPVMTHLRQELSHDKVVSNAMIKHSRGESRKNPANNDLMSHPSQKWMPQIEFIEFALRDRKLSLKIITRISIFFFTWWPRYSPNDSNFFHLYEL